MRGLRLRGVQILAPVLDPVAELYGVLGFSVGSRARTTATQVVSRRIPLRGAVLELVDRIAGLEAAPPGVAGLVVSGAEAPVAGLVVEHGAAGREVVISNGPLALTFVTGPSVAARPVATPHANGATDLLFLAFAAVGMADLGVAGAFGRWSRAVAVPDRGAHRRRLRLGDVLVEVLVPDGPGPVADLLGRSRFAVVALGVAVPDIRPLKCELGARGIRTTGPQQRAEGLFLRVHPPQAGEVPLVFVEHRPGDGPDTFG